MSSEAAIDRVKSELSRAFDRTHGRAFDRTHADLERVEILAAGLAAFSTPIPPYEPRFHHLQRPDRSAHELSSTRKSPG